MKKALLIVKRKKTKEIHQNGWSARKISKELVAGRESVKKWIDLDENKLLQDNRGWKKDKPRKYTIEQKEKK